MSNVPNTTNNAKEPWLSIIIPMYNAEKTISKTIESILMQSFTDYELLLIDDGSTDNSSEVCLKYALKDSRVRYIHKENGGCFGARIHGLKFAAGKYIAFCDADDYYATKDAFAIVFEKIREYDCQMLQFDYIKKFNHLSKRNKPDHPDVFVQGDDFNKNEYRGILCNGYKTYLSPNFWNKVYRADFVKSGLEKIESDNFFWGEDLIGNLCILENCTSALFISAPLYVYTQNGITKKFSARTMKDLDTIKQYQLKFLGKRTENDIDVITNYLFSEIASWLYLNVRAGLDEITDKELEEMVETSLLLPTFKLAREYYLNNTEDWTAVNLLRKANAREYIEVARADKANVSTKDKFKSFLRYIYSKI